MASKSSKISSTTDKDGDALTGADVKSPKQLPKETNKAEAKAETPAKMTEGKAPVLEDNGIADGLVGPVSDPGEKLHSIAIGEKTAVAGHAAFDAENTKHVDK